jgi:hypothetical protein
VCFSLLRLHLKREIFQQIWVPIDNVGSTYKLFCRISRVKPWAFFDRSRGLKKLAFECATAFSNDLTETIKVRQEKEKDSQRMMRGGLTNGKRISRKIFEIFIKCKKFLRLKINKNKEKG